MKLRPFPSFTTMHSSSLVSFYLASSCWEVSAQHCKLMKLVLFKAEFWLPLLLSATTFSPSPWPVVSLLSFQQELNKRLFDEYIHVCLYSVIEWKSYENTSGYLIILIFSDKCMWEYWGKSGNLSTTTRIEIEYLFKSREKSGFKKSIWFIKKEKRFSRDCVARVMLMTH